MKFIKPEDLEIFIITYNRADFLRETLQSLFNQTVQGFKIIVLDNGSTDATPSIVKSFPEVILNRSETNKGQLYNYNLAKELVSFKWVMVFHDDDLIHPEYLETVFTTMNCYSDDNLVLIGSSFAIDSMPTQEWHKFKGLYQYFTNPADFAALLYKGVLYNFAVSIYRTDVFKTLTIDHAQYGKITDRPFLLDAAIQGHTLYFTEPYIKYRIHQKQDSSNVQNGVTPDHIVAYNRKFKKLMIKKLFNKNWLIYLIRNYSNIAGLHSWLSDKYAQISEKELLEYAIKHGAATRFSLILGKFLTVVYRIFLKHFKK